jgi:hypothetical protein
MSGMKLRSGQEKPSQVKVISKKPFNMLGRAIDINPESRLFTANRAVLDLANKWQVPATNMAASLENMYAIAENLKTTSGGKTYLLIDFGPDWLYLLPAPLEGRGARQHPAAAKSGAVYASATNEESDVYSIRVSWGSPPANGLENPTRDAVMGGTARNYASFVYDQEFAEGRSWEWLHIVGHSLGGDNVVGNLVAGTFTANTQMTAYARASGPPKCGVQNGNTEVRSLPV